LGSNQKEQYFCQLNTEQYIADTAAGLQLWGDDSYSIAMMRSF